MTHHSTTRSLSVLERRYLEQVAEAAGGRFARLKLAVGHGVVSWSGSLLIVFVVWLSVAWPARLMGGLDIGLQSPFAPWVFRLGVPLCGVYAVAATFLWIRQQRDLRPALQADLMHGDVAEESYRFTAARRFREPEHGGFIYFFRTDEDRVFVVYDAESRELGKQRKDPSKSRFEPRAELELVRAPNSGVVISRSLSGETLDAGEPSELAIPWKQWPGPDAYCDIPWAELEQRLGGR